MLAVALTAMPVVCPAAAQGITVTPTAGLYMPLTQQLTERVCAGHLPCVTLQTKVTSGPAFGMKLTWDFDRLKAFELAVLSGTGERRTTLENGADYGGPLWRGPATQFVRNTFASLSYYRTWQISDRTSLAAGVGASLISLAGQDAWEDLMKQTAFGPVGSLAFTTGTGPVRLTLGASGTMYAIRYSGEPRGIEDESVMQHDLMFTVGMQIGGGQ